MRPAGRIDVLSVGGRGDMLGAAVLGAPLRALAVPTLLCASALARAGCDPQPVDSSSSRSAAVGTEAPTASASVVPTPTSDTSSTGMRIPTVEVASGLPEGLGPDPASPVVPEATLVTLLSERLTDSISGTLRTVVCDGDLEPGGADQVTCRATTDSAGGTTDWLAYATHTVGGQPAVLWLQGDALAPEFMALLAAPGVTVSAISIGPGYGGDPLDAATVRTDAERVLGEEGAAAVLSGCEGTLDFDVFEPVACTGTAAGAPIRALVLPGKILGGDPGLIVLTQPA